MIHQNGKQTKFMYLLLLVQDFPQQRIFTISGHYKVFLVLNFALGLFFHFICEGPGFN